MARREEIERACPFCDEAGFDAVGLKVHLSSGHCEAYEATSSPARTARIGAPTAEQRARKAAQILIEAIGSVGPENVEDAAVRAADRLATLTTDLATMRSILTGAHGALSDAATVPVPALDEPIADAIRALTKERDDALKVADVATDAAAKAVLDAKDVYEGRHLATIRDLRAAIKECRVYVEDNAAGRFVPSNGAATALLSRLDALLREGA